MKKIHVCEDADELAYNAAEMFVSAMRLSVTERGKFCVALAGGSTPQKMYELLGEKYHDLSEWENTLFFFGDERPVAPDHPDSNYRMSRESLFDHLSIKPEQVFRMQAEGDPEGFADSAYRYQQLLEKNAPQLDLVLLGLGDDGHTASIFADYPDKKVVFGALAASVYVSSKESWRMTLTPTAINSARSIIFLISGENKRSALRQTIENSSTPASRIAPKAGELIYLIDRAAAGDLVESPLSNEFLDGSC